jgi:hypothetical protein
MHAPQARWLVLSLSVMQVAPPLRILDPQEAEERVRARQSWIDLWRAIASEVDADLVDELRDDDEKATAEDPAVA